MVKHFVFPVIDLILSFSEAHLWKENSESGLKFFKTGPSLDKITNCFVILTPSPFCRVFPGKLFSRSMTIWEYLNFFPITIV